MYEHRCIIVPAQIAKQAADMAAQFPSGSGMFERALGLASAPSVPVAYVSAGNIGSDFAAILPLTVWAQDPETGEWVATEQSPGQAQVVADQVGVPVQAVQAIFDACDVSTQTADQAMQRRGLVYVPDTDGGAL